MTVKDDAKKPDKDFIQALKKMKKIYGKPSKINKAKRYALFIRKQATALVAVSKANEGFNLFYTFCKESKCTQIKKTLAK